MSSAGNGPTSPSTTRELHSSSRNSVSFILQTAWLIEMDIGLPADIVPSTFKKKRTAIAPKTKGEEEDEKPGRPTEESARPTGLGRGAR